MFDALFFIECGEVLEGCADSAPGRRWSEGRPVTLMCPTHREREDVRDMVSVNDEIERAA